MSEALKQAIGLFSDKGLKVSIGKVTALSGNTCTVERENLPPLLDVRLQALKGDFSNHLLIKPKLNSQVVCLSVDGETAETCIVQYTEIESVEMSIGGAVLKVENGKLQIKNSAADLKELLTELLAELKTAIIQTPSGIGKFSPNNKLKFEELKNKTTQLLE
ncbi:hypothetical protein [Riemerella columbipharyngis]|uniref:Phage baseplate assembly protein V n=1 Tax=Riemerella columbipharyngis TaxID=1071918 RepID=A0A1G7FJI6_9FLAO|nr:hypothetical protein [Riemerella columbipharyngis]SDE76053.1 hypothetical protein SAMN05421544_12327 [Riemerella columbipharyngis]